MEEKMNDRINEIEKTINDDSKNEEEIMNKIKNYKILNNNEEENIKEYQKKNIMNKENHNVLIKENYDVTNKNDDTNKINDDNTYVKINCENNNEKREASVLNTYTDNDINKDVDVNININNISNNMEKDNPLNDKHNNNNNKNNSNNNINNNSNNNINNNSNNNINNNNNNNSYGDNKPNNILDDTDMSIHNNLNDTSNEKKNVNISNKDIGQNNNSNTSGDMKNYYKDLPTVIIVIGMAGSGKTTYVGSLYNYLKVEQKKKVYTMNLDPAVKYVQYPLNIDIRDSIKYHEIMKEYKLGPNGAIMTCLNLFATRFDKVIEILEKRKNKLHYIIVDTPGQIEVFNWSASGNIILETLSVSFPVVINYIIDTVRCERPITFMSNMLYACSVLYKSRLPFLACFNKIDIIKHDKCIEWMTNYDTFNDDVLNDESYMASFSRSCALMINEFYEGIKTIGVSSKTNEGFNNILKNLQILKEEYLNEYVSSIEKQMKKIKQRKEKDIKIKMEALLMEKQKEISSSKI
ncbi:XPA binding protein 1, putative [Plasmodium sp. DRC-Itaito]|nr:XPA binding protein 1, putative [Plasmodium sp. DRC-Itaito]